MASPSKAIAVDLMGSDKGPRELLSGVHLALDRLPVDYCLKLYGHEPTAAPILKRKKLLNHPQLEFIHCADVVNMIDKPVKSLKEKRDSSLIRSIEAVKKNESLCTISCGNTGSLMAGSTIKLRTSTGIERPALASIVPGKSNPFILLDVGSNPDTTPYQLIQNGILGAHFFKQLFGKTNPRVSLLGIGHEDSKGNENILAATEYAKRLPKDVFDYCGLVEGFDLFEDKVDVVVCDGYTGNSLIKSWEAVSLYIQKLAKESLTKNILRKTLTLANLPAFKELKHRISPDTYSFAPFLGLNGLVLKCHGSSNRYAFKNGILAATQFGSHSSCEELDAAVKLADDILADRKS